MRLYIIRHGETEWNTVRRLQGKTDIALNENGRSLAEVTARALQDIPFDLAYTSPLVRAEETARIILGQRGTPLIREERIREISFGELEGRSILPEYHEMDDPDFHYFFDAPEKYRPPAGGESIEELYRRTGDFLEELARREELSRYTILVSTHGAASRALLANITGCGLRDFWGPGVPKNCAVSVVDRTEGKWTLVMRDKIFYEMKEHRE